MNLGYSFLESENWNAEAEAGIQFRENKVESRSISGGIGGGLGAAFGKVKANGSIAFGVSGNKSENDQSHSLQDINGDGLPDKLVKTRNGVDIYLNTGTGFVKIQENTGILNTITRGESLGSSLNFAITGCAVFPIPSFPVPIFAIKACLNPSHNTGRGQSKTTFQISDVNGDGFPDVLQSNSESNLNTSLSQIGTTNFLKKVNTAMGGTWEVTYKRLPNSYHLQQGKWVMETVTVDDAFREDNQFSPDISKVSVEYGEPYHSRRERTFYGFDKLKINQHDVLNNNTIYRNTQIVYKNKNYFEKGQVVSETLYEGADASKPLSQTTNEYRILRIGETNPAQVQNLPAEEKNWRNHAYFIPLVKTQKTIYEGSQSKSTYTETRRYDAYGNPAQYYEHGEGGADAVLAEIIYSTANTASYIVGKPIQIQVKNNAGIVLRQRQSTIDPVTGNVQQIRIYNGNTAGTFLSAQTQNYNFEYDVYGNITKSIRPINYKGQSFWTTYKYDTQLRAYPVRVDDALGYYSTIEEQDYDFRFGVALYTVDRNQQPMRTRIDAKGRTTEITGPNELFIEGSGLPGDKGEGKNWTIRFDYPERLVAGAPNYAQGAMPAGGWFAITRHYDNERPDDSEGISTLTISDGLGEVVQVKKLSEITRDNRTDQAVYSLPGKVVTDAFGRALKTYYPGIEAYTALPVDPANGNNTPDNVASVRYNPVNNDPADPVISTYDAKDRVLSVRQPGEDLFAKMEYSIEQNLFVTRSTDELNHTKESHTDIKGRTQRVVEYSTQGNIITRFEYDPLGQLLRVTDVDGNITTSTFDNIGRRIRINHPDNGITELGYDAANNLISRKNANGDLIKYEYTFGRLDKVVYPKNPQNSVAYYYGEMEDGSAMSDNAVGRIWYQTDASGTQYFKYGRMGELVYNRRSVVLPGDPNNKTPDPTKVFWFQTSWEYDSWNRVKEIIYPDGEKLKYQYKRGGELHRMTSQKGKEAQTYIDYIGYDKFGQKSVVRYGNGTETTYQYETQRRRLLKMQTLTQKPTPHLIINNTYQYDVMSNVRLIDNDIQPGLEAVGGPSRHEFAYDDLYRLTTANGSWKGKSGPKDQKVKRDRYTLTMAYDQMHNITRKALRVESNPEETGGSWKEDENRTYSLEYMEYNTGRVAKQPHAPRRIIERPLSPDCCDDKPDLKQKLFSFDANGNQTMIRQYICKENDPFTGKELIDTLRINIWDEENRLQAVDLAPDNKKLHAMQINTYDASGERIVKNVERGQYVKLSNGKTEVYYTHDYQIYPSGMLVAHPVFDTISKKWNLGYTKHYYAGSERIVSRIGTSPNMGAFVCDWLIMEQSNGGGLNEVAEAKARQQLSTEAYDRIYKELKAPYPTPAPGGYYEQACAPEIKEGEKEVHIYFYHPDHLGSTSYITDLSGAVVQHHEYIPFGEIFISEHNNNYYNSPYKFNGKEFDAETGYYYYGARYYDPKISLWLSTDPLAEKYPDWSPYAYTFQNPIRFIDPTGMEGEAADDWIRKGDTYFYDSEITNQEQATAKYGKSAEYKFKSGVAYSMNSEGTTLDSVYLQSDGSIDRNDGSPGVINSTVLAGTDVGIRAAGSDNSDMLPTNMEKAMSALGFGASQEFFIVTGGSGLAAGSGSFYRPGDTSSEVDLSLLGSYGRGSKPGITDFLGDLFSLGGMLSGSGGKKVFEYSIKVPTTVTLNLNKPVGYMQTGETYKDSTVTVKNPLDTINIQGDVRSRIYRTRKGLIYEK